MFGDRAPASVFCIIACGRFTLIVKHRRKRNADSVTTGVALRVTKRADLLEFETIDPGFLKQLARRRGFERLVFIYKPAGKGPSPFEWLALALNQQHSIASLRAME